MEKRYDGFDNFQDLIEQFRVDPTPVTDADIVVAVYESESYEGNAFVLYQKDGKLYEVNGSHCSCYGLENQWKPEETSIEAIAMRPRFGVWHEDSAALVGKALDELRAAAVPPTRVEQLAAVGDHPGD